MMRKGKVVTTIDHPDDPTDQLVLVQLEDGSQEWWHGSELRPREDEIAE